MAKVCKDCKKRQAKLVAQLRKEAPAPTGICDLCGTTSKLVLDHDHENGTFRGWLCNGCNVGLGQLGDNATGLIRALAYVNGSSVGTAVGSARLSEPNRAL